MFLTEEEAKTKWCPLTRTPSIQRNMRCLASECMAWRIGKEAKTVQRELRSLTENKVTFHDQNIPALGYCGAFGKAS